MTRPAIVVMAAGMGSRYGGLKQLEPIGPSGEFILDYSLFDALRAGFGSAVFIIKEEMADAFKSLVGDRVSRVMPVKYAFQRLDDLPEGFTPPGERAKPWGTGHAVYSCRDLIDGPFAVINSDDFYGAEAFAKVCDFLKEDKPGEKHRCCMAGYYIENTLTENGHVSRGVCGLSGGGYLNGISERTRIERKDGKIVYLDDSGALSPIDEGTVVSMNLWGFPRGIMREIEPKFKNFLVKNRNNLKSPEFFLPDVVDELIREDKADVRVLTTGAKWYGITYREDKKPMEEAIRAMVKSDIYPERLWRE